MRIFPAFAVALVFSGCPLRADDASAGNRHDFSLVADISSATPSEGGGSPSSSPSQLASHERGSILIREQQEMEDAMAWKAQLDPNVQTAAAKYRAALSDALAAILARDETLPPSLEKFGRDAMLAPTFEKFEASLIPTPGQITPTFSSDELDRMDEGFKVIWDTAQFRAYAHARHEYFEALNQAKLALLPAVVAQPLNSPKPSPFSSK